jgi:hypothetical protein
MAKEAQTSKYLFWIGVVAVIGLHIFTLLKGLPQDQVQIHSIIQIIAGGLIVASHYMK